MTHIEHYCARCAERETAHIAYAERFRKLHWRLVRLTWRYCRLRMANRKLIRENHDLLLMLGEQQERLEVAA